MARERQGCMLCYPFEEKRLARWQKPYISQPKVDGLRATFSKKEGLLSSTGLEITSVPEIVEELKGLHIDEVPLDGELYSRELTFQEICSVVRRTTSLHPDRNLIKFLIFDAKLKSRQKDRIDWLSMFIQDKGPIELLTTFFPDTIEGVMEHLSTFMSAGYEGIIVRNSAGLYVEKRSTDIMKLKPTREDLYPIVGYQEELSILGAAKDSLGAIVCETDGQKFNVGTGFTREQRIKYWKYKERLIGKILKVKYQELTDGGIPRFPVALEVMDVR